MRCLESQERIQRCLDGEPADTECDDWATHLLVCAECREQQVAARCLLDALRRLPPPRPPADLSARICRQILAERTRARRLRRVLLRSALAAGLLLACFALYRAPRFVSLGEQPAQLTGAPSAASTASPSLHRSIAEAGRAVVALTRRAADETVHETRWLLPTTFPPPPSSEPRATSQRLPPPAPALQEIQDGMVAGLEPVARSARRAIGFFWHEISAVENRVQ